MSQRRKINKPPNLHLRKSTKTSNPIEGGEELQRQQGTSILFNQTPSQNKQTNPKSPLAVAAGQKMAQRRDTTSATRRSWSISAPPPLPLVGRGKSHPNERASFIDTSTTFPTNANTNTVMITNTKTKPNTTNANTSTTSWSMKVNSNAKFLWSPKRKRHLRKCDRMLNINYFTTSLQNINATSNNTSSSKVNYNNDSRQVNTNNKFEKKKNNEENDSYTKTSLEYAREFPSFQQPPSKPQQKSIRSSIRTLSESSSTSSTNSVDSTSVTNISNFSFDNSDCEDMAPVMSLHCKPGDRTRPFRRGIRASTGSRRSRKRNAAAKAKTANANATKPAKAEPKAEPKAELTLQQRFDEIVNRLSKTQEASYRLKVYKFPENVDQLLATAVPRPPVRLWAPTLDFMMECAEKYSLNHSGNNQIQNQLQQLQQKQSVRRCSLPLLPSYKSSMERPAEQVLQFHQQLQTSRIEEDPGSFTTMSYNILCDRSVINDRFSCCPKWALDWGYRRQVILEQLLESNADVIALQELEASQYEQFFKPQLAILGNYAGIFEPKSRFKSFEAHRQPRVDGCAIFYKYNKFKLIQSNLCEYAQISMANSQQDFAEALLDRVMTKDNIGLAVILEFRPQDGHEYRVPYEIYHAKGDKCDKEMGFIHSARTSLNGINSLGGGIVDEPEDYIRGAGEPMFTNSNFYGNNNEDEDDWCKFEYKKDKNKNLNIKSDPRNRILVCNTHLHWGADCSDVKIIQTIMLMNELKKIAREQAMERFKQLLALRLRQSGYTKLQVKKYFSLHSVSINEQALGESEQMMPLVLLGDFNSKPDSAVIEFLNNGQMYNKHHDFKKLNYMYLMNSLSNSNRRLQPNQRDFAYCGLSSMRRLSTPADDYYIRGGQSKSSGSRKNSINSGSSSDVDSATGGSKKKNKDKSKNKAKTQSPQQQATVVVKATLSNTSDYSSDSTEDAHDDGLQTPTPPPPPPPAPTRRRSTRSPVSPVEVTCEQVQAALQKSMEEKKKRTEQAAKDKLEAEKRLLRVAPLTHYYHPFNLASAYAPNLMKYTNYSQIFKETIDYVYYTQDKLQALGRLSSVDLEDWFVANNIQGLPQPYLPSDHLPLMVRFRLNNFYPDLNLVPDDEHKPRPKKRNLIKRIGKPLKNHTKSNSGKDNRKKSRAARGY